ncbi:MAG: T9SS type A sorting domain-containing protein [Saprospiraceae bacterium]|nr:T9SS type A sorting domain-containing protein [Saprospiraceae bacterium]
MMKTKMYFWFYLLIFYLLPNFTAKGQTEIVADCFSSDLGGVTSAGDPDIISIGAVSGSEAHYFFDGCLAPSDGDYHDLFRIFVPEGYELSAVQMGYVSEPFFDGTVLRMDLWYGDNCSPLGSPDLGGGVYGANTDAGNLSPSILFGLASLPGNSWYSFRIDTEGWPSSMLYHFHFTLTCADNVTPVFTTPAGSLDASLSCSNAAAIAAALADEPEGSDNSGNVELILTDDDTVPEPGCPNAYTRTRTWILEDECGNQSSSFTQTITVTDNTPPSVVSPVGSMDINISCSNPAALAVILGEVPVGYDACGTATPVLQLDSTIPDPDCPNAYLRIRTWRFVDECSNQSLAVFNQTITVYDNEDPVFTTAPNALNATLECSDLAGIAAALSAEPTGTDNCGSVELELFWDIITPDPDCPNAYTHERVWRLIDECGNHSGNYGQTITVYDNTAPVVVALDGPVAISDINGYEFQLEDLIDINTSYDNCSDELKVVSIIPSMVTCEQLGMFIPVEIEVEDECGNSTVVVAIKEVTEDLSIKPPFQQSDIGATANGGALHYVCDEEFHVWSSGYSTLQSDVAHFVYVEMCGDGEITARLNSVLPAGAIGGLMVREDLTPGSRKMAMESSLSNVIRRDIRSIVNGNSMLTQWPIMPGMVWLRINRTGNMFNLYTSSDGINWQFRGASQLVLQECVLMGIYTESINNPTQATAIFDEVTVSGGVAARPDISGFNDVVTNVENVKSDLPSAAFPNPATDDLWINLNEMAELDICVEILDLNGRSLKYQSFSEGLQQIHLDVSNLGQGMYICRLQSKCGHIQVLKFIKE